MKDSTGPSGGRPLDLSDLPDPVRATIQRQLDKLPPQLREKLLREGSPILEKAIAKAREQARAATASAARFKSDAAVVKAVPKADIRYEQATRDRVPTVMPGDSDNHAMWLFVGAVALVAIAWYVLQG
jgi:hypothetical protein